MVAQPKGQAMKKQNVQPLSYRRLISEAVSKMDSAIEGAVWDVLVLCRSRKQRKQVLQLARDQIQAYLDDEDQEC